MNENIYRALTFFTIEHLAERDNFLASKPNVIRIYNKVYASPLAEATPWAGSSHLRTYAARKGHPTTRHAKPGMAGEPRRTTFWQPAGRGFSGAGKGDFVKVVTRGCKGRHQTMFGDDLYTVR